jgi:hypothetical protein
MLRIGVALDGMRPPAWAAWLLSAIRAHDELDLTLAVLSDHVPGERPSTLFAAYEALDRRVFSRPPDALEPVDISPALQGIASLHLGAAPAQGYEDAPDAEPGADQHTLDVLVCLGTALAPNEIPLVPRHGVWSLHLGDPDRYRGEPALFWELSFAEPASTSVLESVSRRPEERRVLYRSWTATDPVSLQRTRNPVYWKSARFVLRRLDDLAADRWSPELEPASNRPSPVRSPPSNAEAVRHAARIAWRVGRRRLRRAAFRRQWFLGIRQRQGDRLPHEDPRPWQVVSPPADRYWADPFVVEHDGDTLVFIEQVRYSDYRGELAVGRVERGGELSALQPILSAGHHLSYPYVLRDEGQAFMIPESGEAGRVELWAANDFPTSWSRAAVLLEDVRAVDASVLRHGGLYWMWVNQSFDGGRLDDETFLYFSDRLDSGWTAHPRNPVVSDARHARPAGRPFLHGEVLIRPAQDCTGGYGSRVVFNAVESLTTEDYVERPVGTLGPDWAPGRNLGAHTYTFDGSWEATDCQGLVSRLRR